ncbi:flagellar basal body P-ring formation chaperone FlgA [Idiomarina xiamenensis]|uniref:Flagella basal body P-ring formation protein FlgA n=1 Tax=Idiomarina xiamenensis 10-D-4 TaxID=740709 RepID=K2KHC2_9GAMM|nr:flagellar basal body P-ring formation chaperone FlgA [Idiomarina xiamenensis]EKE82064.1 flagellar basal body P-ring biosynthesis protein FlgA [Idiomarina xiamenensis 10-D-4]
MTVKSMAQMLICLISLNFLAPAQANAQADAPSMKNADGNFRYDHKALQQIAEQFIRQQVSAPENGEVRIEASALDPRLVPKVCQQSADISLANNARLDRYTTVEIRCELPTQWRAYVPVRIFMMAPVVVAAQPLTPGTLLNASDLSIAMVDTQAIRAGLYHDIESLVGARVKRRISAQEPIKASSTCLVCEGERVTIVAGQKGMRITATGIALADGLQGESVVVRNQRSNREVHATVAGLNEVTVE